MRRNDTTELADELAMYNIKAIAYHAGLLPAQREQAQNDFINDRVDVVCATVAFGMVSTRVMSAGSCITACRGVSRITTKRSAVPEGTDEKRYPPVLFLERLLIVLRRFAEESGQSEVNLEKLNRMRRYCESGHAAAVSCSVTSARRRP